MLSIIISSYQPEYFSALEKNIAETNGLPFEIIKIENPGIMGICEAYNKGAEKAKFDYLLFLHEDVLFHTNNWGEKLINHLKDPETGIIGIAGSDYVPVVPCSWYINHPQHHFLYLIQNTKNADSPTMMNTMKEDKKHLVFALDGVFLAMKTETYQQFKFNEKISVFHGYDTEISLNIAKKYNNYVISDVLIEHFSLGGADNFFFNANIFVRKLHGSDYQQYHDKNIEFERFKNFVNQYIKWNGLTIYNLIKTIKFLPYNKIDITHFNRIIRMYYLYLRYPKYFKK